MTTVLKTSFWNYDRTLPLIDGPVDKPFAPTTKTDPSMADSFMPA